MQLASQIPIRGDLTVSVRDVKSGRRLRRMEIRNTVTYLGMASLVQLLAQRSADPLPTTFKINELWVGEGNTPPTRGDTALADPLGFAFKVPVTDANKILSLTGPFELRIAATLGASSANGKFLREAALYTAVPSIFARQIHPQIEKTSAIAVDYDWRLSFTA
jgi:hypothetical protein